MSYIHTIFDTHLSSIVKTGDVIYSSRSESFSFLKDGNRCFPGIAGTSHGQPEGKQQPTVEEGSSARADDEARAHTENSFPTEYPAIRPGMAAEVKFGGSGSLPNLPWVSTSGPGPNGRTISGVTYRFSSNQIKIVCACHGLHMSPEDFIQHASEEPPPVTDSVAAGSSTGGGLASAKS